MKDKKANEGKIENTINIKSDTNDNLQLPKELMDDYRRAVNNLKELGKKLDDKKYKCPKHLFEEMFIALFSHERDSDAWKQLNRYLHERFSRSVFFFFWFRYFLRMLGRLFREREFPAPINLSDIDTESLNNELKKFKDALYEIIVVRERIQDCVDNGKITEHKICLQELADIDNELRWNHLPVIPCSVPNQILDDWYYCWREVAEHKKLSRWYWYQSPSDHPKWMILTYAFLLWVWFLLAPYFVIMFDGKLDSLNLLAIIFSLLSTLFLGGGAIPEVRELISQTINQLTRTNSLRFGGQRIFRWSCYLASIVTMFFLRSILPLPILPSFPSVASSIFAWLGEQEEKRGAIDTAQQFYKKATVWNPATPDARYKLARIMEEHDDSDAIENYRHLFDISDVRWQLKAQALVGLSRIYLSESFEKPNNNNSLLNKAVSSLEQSVDSNVINLVSKGSNDETAKFYLALADQEFDLYRVLANQQEESRIKDELLDRVLIINKTINNIQVVENIDISTLKTKDYQDKVVKYAEKLLTLKTFELTRTLDQGLDSLDVDSYASRELELRQAYISARLYSLLTDKEDSAYRDKMARSSCALYWLSLKNRPILTLKGLYYFNVKFSSKDTSFNKVIPLTYGPISITIPYGPIPTANSTGIYMRFDEKHKSEDKYFKSFAQNEFKEKYRTKLKVIGLIPVATPIGTYMLFDEKRKSEYKEYIESFAQNDFNEKYEKAMNILDQEDWSMKIDTLDSLPYDSDRKDCINMYHPTLPEKTQKPWICIKKYRDKKNLEEFNDCLEPRASAS
jgi:hypothetical protein